jgi:hypothetical protein
VNTKVNWQTEYKREIAQARSARGNGNEAMARVCARRAAGIVVGEYLHRQGFGDLNQSAYDHLQLFTSLPQVDKELKIISSHFLMKVNHDHNLPVDADLINEVQWLAKTLLLENND